MTGAGAPHLARRTEQGIVAQACGLCAGATGRLTRLVHCLAIASLGFGAWAILRMIDGAGIVEQLLWMGAAWVAWSAIIAIKLWVWNRANGFGAPATAEAPPIAAVDEIGELQVQPA